MFVINTRNFPPELGGIQVLMGGLSKALLNYGPVKIFAEKHENSETHDKEFQYDITRVSGIKLFRKFRKANLVNSYLKENPSIKALITDHWKSLEYLNEKNLLHKKTLCLIHSKEINHPIKSRLNDRMLKSISKADFIIANSSFTKSLAINNGIQEKKIKVIHPGVNFYEEPDENNLRTAENIFKDSFPCLITVARFDKRKGHDKTIMAIRNLKEKFPKIKYICIGHGDEEKNLKKLVRELKLENIVIFMDNINPGLKSALIKKSHLFVMPSIVYKKSVEGFGIAFIEAGQHGTPSIGGKDGGESDAIIHNKTGLICNGNDLDSIYQSINNILEEEKYLKFGNNAKEFSKQFEWNRIIKKYIELLN